MRVGSLSIARITKIPIAVTTQSTILFGSELRYNLQHRSFLTCAFNAGLLVHNGSVPTALRSHSRIYSQPQGNEERDSQAQVEDLRVPENWSVPSKALEESEWLRVNLHKWLDDEYCPEATNVEISKVAARSYHNSLLEKHTDLGEILLKMASELESISYQDSFHGAFSSANAAISLIIQRIEQV